MRRLIPATLLIPTAIACAGREPPPRVEPPPPDAPIEVTVARAAERWYRTTGLDPLPRIRFIRLGDCDRVMGDSDAAYWGCWSSADLTVTIDYRAPAGSKYLVLTHEFGHALGADHVPGSVMREVINNDARCLSRADVNAVCGVEHSPKCRWRRPECER